jgi:hypothetical protein
VITPTNGSGSMLPTNYDAIEASELDWLKKDWPNYLAFHEAQAYHLPANFLDGTSREPLMDTDPRWNHLNRIGFLSYSIFVNLVLAKRITTIASAPADVLEVYDRTSRHFLRIGAAIDQAEFLEKECAKSWQSNTLGKGRLPNPSWYSTLKTTLSVVDKYNNYLKHNGLPAIQFEQSDGHQSILIPSRLASSNHRLWSDQSPDAAFQQVFQASTTDAVRAFDTFYEQLAITTNSRLANLKLIKNPDSDLRGIQTLLQTPLSGALKGLDGYQSADASFSAPK